MTVNQFEIADTSELFDLFAGVRSNPYTDYVAFRQEVQGLIRSHAPAFTPLREIGRIFTETPPDIRKVALIKGGPIDRDVPIFDPDDPVNDKHAVKKTFVGEVYLETVSQLFHLPILSYTTRNRGDFFQDVYAQNKYTETQTQKTDSDLFFHNDRTAHKVRADVLCLLGMRSDPMNIINTKYVHGIDLIEIISPTLREVLRQPYFVTPFDLISQDSNEFQVSSEIHAILIESAAFRYYDTRTTVADGAPEIAWRALTAIKDAIVRAPTVRIPIQTGDLFIFPNLEGLHSRDKAHVPFPDAARQRYLLKTYNFWNEQRRDRFAELYVPGVPGFVDDARIDHAHFSVA